MQTKHDKTGETVTQKMIDAGNTIASQLIDGILRKQMGEISGKTLSQWMDENKSDPNIDLIEQYLDNTIDSVTAIYLAMRRQAP